jgi:hypothetical protein
MPHPPPLQEQACSSTVAPRSPRRASRTSAPHAAQQRAAGRARPRAARRRLHGEGGPSGPWETWPSAMRTSALGWSSMSRCSADPRRARQALARRGRDAGEVEDDGLRTARSRAACPPRRPRAGARRVAAARLARAATAAGRVDAGGGRGTRIETIAGIDPGHQRPARVSRAARARTSAVRPDETRRGPRRSGRGEPAEEELIQAGDPAWPARARAASSPRSSGSSACERRSAGGLRGASLRRRPFRFSFAIMT